MDDQTTGIEAPCPLCGQVFDADDAYAEHLADVHDLVDDEGAETTVEQALIVSGVAGDLALAAEAAGAAGAAGAGPGVTSEAAAVHPSRVYDPGEDDVRWKPFVLGLTGVALLLLIGFGISGLGGDDDDGAQVATVDLTSTTVALDPAALSTPTDPAATVTEVPTDATTASTGPATGAPTTTRPPGAGSATPDSGPRTTTPPPTTAAPTPSPAPNATTPPTSPPPPPPTAPPPTSAPPTTARPTFASPALSGARIDGCQRSGPNATWTFSYVLSGGANWQPAPGAQAMGGGRYRETRTGRRQDGFPSAVIQVVDTTTGQSRSIALSPSLLGAAC